MYRIWSFLAKYSLLLVFDALIATVWANIDDQSNHSFVEFKIRDHAPGGFQPGLQTRMGMSFRCIKVKAHGVPRTEPPHFRTPINRPPLAKHERRSDFQGERCAPFVPTVLQPRAKPPVIPTNRECTFVSNYDIIWPKSVNRTSIHLW